MSTEKIAEECEIRSRGLSGRKFKSRLIKYNISLQIKMWIVVLITIII